MSLTTARLTQGNLVACRQSRPTARRPARSVHPVFNHFLLTTQNKAPTEDAIGIHFSQSGPSDSGF